MLIANTRWWPFWDVNPEKIVKQAYKNLITKAEESGKHLLSVMKDDEKRP